MVQVVQHYSPLSKFIKNWFQPVIFSVGTTLVIAVSVFVLVTLPTFRAKMDFIIKSVEEVKQYEKDTDKIMIEALVKQGILETRINDLERQMNYQNNNNQKLRP